MRRIIFLISAVLFAMSMLATSAAAWHEHEIVHTHPVTEEERVLNVFSCEPAHIGNDPHPIHFGLHNAVDPDTVDQRGNPGPITVGGTGEDCPSLTE